MNEREIERVMRDLKLDRIQAINHIKSRNMIQEQLRRTPLTAEQILGKSAVYA